MKSLTKCVIASFALCILYTAVAIILECRGVTLPDTLTQYFFTTFGIEFAASAGIRITKHIVSSKQVDDKVKRAKEEGLTIDKADLKQNDEEDNIYYG